MPELRGCKMRFVQVRLPSSPHVVCQAQSGVDGRHETHDDGWHNPVLPKKGKEDRRDADVRRQFEGMNLVIALFFSKIHFRSSVDRDFHKRVVPLISR
jgi:hypothetical protein